MNCIKVSLFFLLTVMIMISFSCTKKKEDLAVESSSGSSSVDGGLSDSYITGTLTLPDETPASGAEVYIKGYPDYKATADSSGNFSIAVPNAIMGDKSLKTVSSEATIIVEKESNGQHYGLQKTAIDATSDDERSIGDVSLSLVGHIQVTATLVGQTDFTGIDVYIPGTSYDGKTDSDGSLTLSNIPAGTWDLRIEKDGYVYRDLTDAVVVSDETTLVEDINLIIDVGVDGEIIINGGQGYATDENLDITIMHTSNATLYKLSQNADFLNVSWSPIADSATFELSSSNAGSYVVYVMFANANGLTSSPKTKTISILSYSMSPTSGITSSDYTPVVTLSYFDDEAQDALVEIYSDSDCTTLSASELVDGASATVSDIAFASDGSEDGAVYFYAKITDNQGAVSSCLNLGLSYTLNTLTPSIESNLFPTSGTTSNDYTPIISITSLQNDANGGIARIYANSNCSTQVGSATVSENAVSVSNITFADDGSEDGTVHFYAKITDNQGALSSCLDLELYYALDRTSPTAPSGWTMSSPSVATTSSDYTPTISGTSISNADNGVAYVYDTAGCSGSVIGSATVMSGSFSLTNISYPSNGSSNGTKAFYGKISDAYGNESSCASLGLGYLLDTSAPTVTLSTPQSNVLVASVTVGGTCSENSRAVSISSTGGGTVTTTCSEGSYSTSINPSYGAVTITANHTDAAENDAVQASVSIVRIHSSSSMALGAFHTCSLLSDASIKCWGLNDYGAAATGPYSDFGEELTEMGSNLSSVLLGTGRTALKIVAKSNHTCTVLDNSNVKCWGTDGLGQGNSSSFGNASNQMGNNLSTINLGSGRTATEISVGVLFSCAQLDNGNVKCWGTNGSGQLGKGNVTSAGNATNQMGDNLSNIILGAGRTAVAIVSGDNHTCVLLDNDNVKCWGANGSGYLGQGHMNSLGNQADEMGDNLSTINLGAGRTASAMAAGLAHSCAILDNGNVKCWGNNDYGQLGQGHANDLGDQADEMGDNLSIINLGAGRTATTISAGSNYTCAVLDNSSIKCWGRNDYAQLGLGHLNNIGDEANEMGNNLVTINLGFGNSAIAVSGGLSFTCAILTNSEAKCWGLNQFGELGIGLNGSIVIGDSANEMGDNLSIINL